MPLSPARGPGGLEWAFRIPSAGGSRALRAIRESERSRALADRRPADPLAAGVLDRVLPAIVAAKGESPFRRVYLGSEFCERLIPGEGDLREVLGAAREEGLGVTLLAPWTGDEGIDRLRPILRVFEREAGAGAEVAAGDWGALGMLRREHPGLAPVLGRLLDKAMRDPRAAPIYPRTTPAARRVLSGSSASLPAYRRFLVEMGIRRIELDALPQGIGLDLRGSGIAAALHIPFGAVATGRPCLAGSLHLDPADRLRFDLPCCMECRDWTVELRDVRPPFGPESLILLQKGNALFYAVEGEILAEALGSLERIGADRVVMAFDLPF
jgi:hypothetical protein